MILVPDTVKDLTNLNDRLLFQNQLTILDTWIIHWNLHPLHVEPLLYEVFFKARIIIEAFDHDAAARDTRVY